jgi:inner membrane protein
MDPITHALAGSLAAKVVTRYNTTDESSLPSRDPLIIAAIAGIFPDIDYLSFWINPLIFIADWHRSFTHSLLMAPLWGLLLTTIMVTMSPRLRESARSVYLYTIIGLLSHILLDILTVYGTEIFYPWSDMSVSLATTFIIDPYFTTIIVLTLLISLQLQTRLSAFIGTALLLVYISVQWQLKLSAIQITQDFGAEQITIDSKITALPQPFSPLYWRVIVQRDQEYSTALLDISGFSEKLFNSQAPNNWYGLISAYKSRGNLYWQDYSLFDSDPDKAPTSLAVWQHDDMEKFRQFAEFPVLYRFDESGSETCVWFTDLRYLISTMMPTFRYGMCRETDDGSWQLYRLRRLTENNKQRINP